MQSTNLSQENGIVILMPQANLVGGLESDELETLLMKFAAWGNRQMIVDLQRVSILNSAGLRSLEHGVTACAELGGLLRVCNVSRRINDFIGKFALVQPLETFETIGEAIESLGGERDDVYERFQNDGCLGEAVFSD